MNKAELMKEVSEISGYRVEFIREVTNILLHCMKEAIKNGDGVSVRGFGEFNVQHRVARKGRNPQTGEPLTVEAHNVVTFKAGRPVRDAANGRNWA